MDSLYPEVATPEELIELASIRPPGVAVLGVSGLVAGASLLVVGLWLFPPFLGVALLFPYVLSFAYLTLILCLLSRNPRAWLLMLVFQVIAIFTLVGLAPAVGIIYYLGRPHVRAYFGKTSPIGSLQALEEELEAHRKSVRFPPIGTMLGAMVLALGIVPRLVPFSYLMVTLSAVALAGIWGLSLFLYRSVRLGLEDGSLRRKISFQHRKSLVGLKGRVFQS